MKISIITPTYNDAKYIEEMLESLKIQTYKNWELIIVDDGSTDNTKSIISDFKNKNINLTIKYIYQENQDQLNAIINGLNFVNGDYIYILHSDDLLKDNKSLETAINFMINNDCDAVIADLELIDQNSNKIGVQKVKKYKNKKYYIPLQLLWLGRNIYCDTALVKKDIYMSKIKYNYLTWNVSFWLDLQEKPNMLNVKTMPSSMMKYRISDDNYIKNEVGQLNVINGELRTVSYLLKYYNIPFYKIQYYIYRIFNKLHLVSLYRPIYFNKETKNKSKIVDFVIKKRYGMEYNKYPFLNSIQSFYTKKSNRTISIKDINEKEFIFKGKDIRKFNNLMLKNKLSNFYNIILREIKEGFDIIETTKKDYDKVVEIMKFFCVYPNIRIIIKEDE